jgi:integrase
MARTTPSSGVRQYIYSQWSNNGSKKEEQRMGSDSGERGVYKRKRHDGEYWAYRFQYEGKSYSETTDLKATQKLLPDAKRARAKHLQRVRLGRCANPTAAIRFSDATEKFVAWTRMEHREHPRTAQRQATSLAIAARAFGDLCLDEITTGDIESFKMIRRQGEIAEVTIRKDLITLSQVFKFGIKHRWVDRNPVKDVRLPSDRDSFNERTISPEEEALYFAQASQQKQVLYDVGRLMLWQGLRPSEALALTKDDVDIQGRLLFIRHGKSRASRRELHLIPSSVEILGRRLASQYAYLFPGWCRLRGRWHHNGKAYTYSGLINAHKEVLVTLNGPADEHKVIEPFDMYSLRHTFATRFYQATKDIDKLARILGHSDLSTVRRYVNPSQDDLREAMKVYEAAVKRRAARSEPPEGEADTAAEAEMILTPQQNDVPRDRNGKRSVVGDADDESKLIN